MAKALDADFIINPLCHLHKVIPVQGLSGCPMAPSGADGVVDSSGRDFHYRGLHVAYNSAMPGLVGAKQWLTTAALAGRFSDHMVRRAT